MDFGLQLGTPGGGEKLTFRCFFVSWGPDGSQTPPGVLQMAPKVLQGPFFLNFGMFLAPFSVDFGTKDQGPKPTERNKEARTKNKEHRTKRGGGVCEAVG